MYTAAEVERLKERLEAEGKSKAEIVVALAWACFGWPYVWGAWGAMCTPEERRTRAGYRPDKKEQIYGKCPVLSGEQTTCAGCKWYGTRCFDCRGLTDWLLKQVGLDLYGDTCGAQYEKESNWAVRGNYADMPAGLVGCVFERKNGKWKHTGMHVGMGVTVHCSGTVQDGGRDWTAYGIPAGLYTDEELKEAGVNVGGEKNTPTLRKGAEGELVKKLQELLNRALDARLDVDGKFGAKTEEVVKLFQAANGLKADGIVGPKTWAELAALDESEPDHNDPESWPEEPAKEPEEPATHPPDEDTVTVSKTMLAYIAGCLEDLAADLRGYAGEM